VLAGATSFAAIGEWAADASSSVLAALGIRADPLTGLVRPPHEATMRRVLTTIDGDALDTAIGIWLAGPRTPPTLAAEPITAGRPWRAVAVDGKTLRGSGPPGDQVHLLAAADHTTGAVLSQFTVDGKTNESPCAGARRDGVKNCGSVARRRRCDLGT